MVLEDIPCEDTVTSLFMVSFICFYQSELIKIETSISSQYFALIRAEDEVLINGDETGI